MTIGIAPTDTSRYPPPRDADDPAVSDGQGGAWGSGADFLLATKVALPAVAGDLVARPRLHALLDAGLAGGRPLTVVTAPAGWGKTTLLADWAARAARPVAWVALDDGDNDPVRFWRYVLAALDRVAPGRWSDAAAGFRAARPGMAGTDAAAHGIPTAPLTALLNAAADLPTPTVLVLDNVHDVTCAPIHAGLALLVHHLPPTLHVVLAGRADPPLPLARLRAQGRVTEVRAADLRFALAEATAFLNGPMRLELPAADIEALAARTEGWIAGLHLAALSLRGRPDPQRFIAAFTGSHRAVVDYLVEEVLGCQPAPTREFLLQTSILPRLTGPLCDAVTGRADGRTALADLERAGLFLLPLDEERRWYRYHGLFAALLRDRLDEVLPGLAPDLHRRAAAWYETHGQYVEAIDQLTTAPDPAAAADLIERSAKTVLWSCGEVLTLRRWLDNLPNALVRSRPRLCLAHAWSRALTGQLAGAEARLADAEAAPGSVDEDGRMRVDERGGLRGEIAAVRARIAALRDDIPASLAASERALADLPPEDGVLWGDVALGLGFALQGQGRLADAERAFADAHRAGEQFGNRRTAMLATRYLIGIAVARGRLRAAEAAYRDALAEAIGRGEVDTPTTGLLHVGLGEILYERDDLPAAEQELRRGLALGARGGEVKVLLPGHVALAHLRHALRDDAGATAALHQAERLMPSGFLAAAEARLALATGDDATAERWARGAAPGLAHPCTFASEFEHATLVRVLISRRDARGASELATRLLHAAEADGRDGGVAEALVLRALAAQAAGDRDGAEEALTQALALGEPEGARRTFLDEGPIMAEILARVAHRGGPATGDGQDVRPYAAGLVRAMTASAAPAGPPASDHAAKSRANAARPVSLPEPLSARELEVLGHVAAGRTNAEIADALSISVGTVKTHVHRICGKLGARTRTEALARAATLALLPALAATR